MNRFLALLASTVLVASIVVVGGAPASAACAPRTKAVSGTVQGEDGRFVYALIGVDVHDANGNRIGADGCPSAGGYADVAQVNRDLPASGAVSGAGLTKSWSIAVPANAAKVFIEAYPKTSESDPPGATDKTRYGSVLRHDVPISSGYNLNLPLNCGIDGGTNGTIIGRVTKNGQPITPTRVMAWTLSTDTAAQPLGWTIAEITDGGFRAEALASNQKYQIYVTAGGTTKRLLWIPVSSCETVNLNVDMNPDAIQTVPGATFYLSNSLAGGNADVTSVFGFSPDEPVVGDFDGNSFDDIGVRRGNRFEVRYSTGPGVPSKTFTYGKPGDELFIGDWDGDGIDTLAVRRGKTFYVRNDTNSGPAHVTFGYGKAGDEVFVGDWDGDGKDTFAVRRGNVFYLRNDLQPGNATTVFGYGKAGDEVLIGDWDGDNQDTFAVRRSTNYFLRNDTRSGAAHITFSYGKPGDLVLVGDWNSDRIDTFGVYR